MKFEQIICWWDWKIFNDFYELKTFVFFCTRGKNSFIRWSISFRAEDKQIHRKLNNKFWWSTCNKFSKWNFRLETWFWHTLMMDTRSIGTTAGYSTSASCIKVESGHSGSKEVWHLWKRRIRVPSKLGHSFPRPVSKEKFCIHEKDDNDFWIYKFAVIRM